jgi:hypothetical protein
MKKSLIPILFLVLISNKGSLGSDAQDLINILMRKVSRRIPYTK